MTYMFLKSNIFVYLLLCVEFIYAVQVPNPVLWERSFTMNVTSGDNTGNLIQSTSNMATSQDFQGIHVDANSRFPPERIIFNFGVSCHSSNQTAETIRQLNYNSLQVPAIVNAQKLALVKRGNCNWSEKLTVVNQLATASNINITAVYIYDNSTHSEIAIDRKPVVGTGSQGPPNYPNALPTSRSILNMSDNDLDMTNPSTTTVYFLPYVYGNTLVTHVNQTYNTTNPDIRQYWLITPYLEEVSWGYTGEENFFSSGKAYLSYIIALAAIFLIGVIFLRWWRIRRMRGEYPYGGNGFTGGNGLHMQPRTNQLDPLPVDLVNGLPVDKYTDDLVKNVNCAICIEDFVPGKSDIRILPCGHGFCVLCIDPWLTQKSTLCPICKWDCLPIDLRRERNMHQQQQEQQQEQQRQDRQDPSNDSFAVNMTTPLDDVPVSPEVEGPTMEPRNTIPTPILPAATSSASNRGSDENPFNTLSSSATNSSATVGLDEKRDQNPFEGSQLREIVEQTTSPIANVPAFTAEADLSSAPAPSEKKSHSKGQ